MFSRGIEDHTLAWSDYHGISACRRIELQPHQDWPAIDHISLRYVTLLPRRNLGRVGVCPPDLNYGSDLLKIRRGTRGGRHCMSPNRG